MNGNHVILLKINNTFTNTLKLSKFFKYKNDYIYTLENLFDS